MRIWSAEKQSDLQILKTTKNAQQLQPHANSEIFHMKPIYYTAPKSIGLATHVALEESGLPYELRVLDMTLRQQADKAYLAINPKARVPSLVVGEDILTETPALLFYLAQIAPGSSIALPSAPLSQAKIQSFNSYLCSTVHVAHAHKMRGTRWVDDKHALDAMTANVPNTMAACFDMIENQFFLGPWVHGEAFSISDPYLFAITEWFESDGVDIDDYPKLKTHRQNMQSRESVKQALIDLKKSS